MTRNYEVSNLRACVFPMERHRFEGADFYCSVCSRPRAMHLNTGFTPQNTGHTVCMEAYVPYRFDRRRVIIHRPNPWGISYAENHPVREVAA